MKVGDKVRFLNEVGGGEIVGFPEKGIVLVQDADGFEIPVMEREVVVIETNHLNIPKPATTAKPASGVIPNRAAMADVADEDLPEVDLADLPLAYRPKTIERKGGDELNLFLAFVPQRIKELSTTRFDVYLVNDTNFHYRFALLGGEDGMYELLVEDVVGGNAKLHLAEISLADLPRWKRLLIQGYLYKEDKSFAPKPAESIALRVDATKFYKLHTFRPSEFFTAPALLLDIYRNDRPAHPMVFKAEDIEQGLQHQEQPARVVRQPARKEENGILIVDLHATELLETTAGLSPKEILDFQVRTFRETMNELRREKGRKIVFIHGKGNGVLRNAVEQDLRHRYRSCTYQDASFQEYGYGATLVTIR